MKKLFIIALFLVAAQAAYSQYYYRSSYDNARNKSVTFQVAPTVLSYDGVKYGFGFGMNVKQVLSINYYHTRDYGTNVETPYMDNRFAGLHISVAQPLAETLELAGGLRKGFLNGDIEKTVLSAELRYKFSDSWRLAFEYGGNSQRNMTSVRLLFNLY
ncbi:hypothetical protein [Roseivirga sp.]|uniref:hypothetical protein n=1 Tax=Roseivirga sp. TaxID=1964215 RepID=UPI003B51E1AA